MSDRGDLENKSLILAAKQEDNGNQENSFISADNSEKPNIMDQNEIFSEHSSEKSFKVKPNSENFNEQSDEKPITFEKSNKKSTKDFEHGESPKDHEQIESSKRYNKNITNKPSSQEKSLKNSLVNKNESSQILLEEKKRKLFQFESNTYVYYKNAENYHTGIPWETFDMPHFKYLTQIKTITSFKYLVAAFQFEDRLSLVKYHLNTGNENKEHFVTITNIIDEAHDLGENIDSAKNHYQKLRAEKFCNKITAIAFSYKTTGVGEVKKQIIASRVQSGLDSTKTPKNEVATSIHMYDNLSPLSVFTGDLIGVIKQWNFHDLKLLKTFDIWKSHSIIDLHLISNSDLAATSNMDYEKYNNEGAVIITAHHDGVLRKFNTGDPDKNFTETKKEMSVSFDPSSRISVLQVGRFEDEYKIAIGTRNGVVRFYQVYDLECIENFGKLSSQSSKITAILFTANFFYICDYNGSIKKVFTDHDVACQSCKSVKTMKGDLSRYCFIQQKYVLPESIQLACLSPDRQFLVISGKTVLKMISIDTNASIKQWRMDKNGLRVNGLIYTRDSIIQTDLTGIKMRFDTDFTGEFKETLPETNRIYAFCFTHSNKENSSFIYVLGDFGEKVPIQTEEFGDVLRTKLQIKKMPYGNKKQECEVDPNSSEDFDDEGDKFIETFESKCHFLIGKSYVIAITPDDKKLVATSYMIREGELSLLTINVYDTKEKTLLYFYSQKGYSITDIKFSNDSNSMFASFYKSNVMSFNFEKEIIYGRNQRPKKNEAIDLKHKIEVPGYLEVDKRVSHNRIPSICLTSDEVFQIVLNVNEISIQISGLCIEHKKQTFQEFENSDKHKKKKVLTTPQIQKILDTIIQQRFPQTTIYKEQPACVIPHRDPKFFYCITKRGTLIKYMICQTYNKKNETVELPYFADKIKQDDIQYLTYENVRADIVPMIEVKFKDYDPNGNSDETATLLAYYPRSVRDNTEKRLKVRNEINSMTANKIFKDNFEDIKDTPIKVLHEQLDQAEEKAIFKIKFDALNNVCKKVHGGKVASEYIAKKNMQQNKIEHLHQNSLETYLIAQEQGERDHYLIWYCQGNIKIYSPDCRFIYDIIKRDAILSADSQHGNIVKDFGIFCPDLCNCFTAEILPKNQFKISNDDRFLVMNCYNKLYDELNLFEQDTFFHNGKAFETTANYCHYETTNFYNIYKGMNFFTSYILEGIRTNYIKISKDPSQKIEKEILDRDSDTDDQKADDFMNETGIEVIKTSKHFDKQLYLVSEKKILNRISNYDKLLEIFKEPHNIIEKYKSVLIISECDVVVLISAQKIFGLEEYIPRFIDVVINNNTAQTPQFSFFLKRFAFLSEYSKSKAIVKLVENQLVSIPNMYATKDLVKKKFLQSKLTLKNIPETEDLKTFDIALDVRNPLESDLYKLKIPTNLEIADDLFFNYQNNIQEYIHEDEPIWEDDLFTDFIDSLWGVYQIQQLVYVTFSMIPMICMFMIGFDLKKGDTHISLTLITCVTTFALNLYEIIQMISSKGMSYWMELINYIDIIAQFLTQTFSLYSLFGNGLIICTEDDNGSETCTANDKLKSIYVFAFVFQIFKFYLNLAAVNQIRHLSNKIFDITYGIRAFFVIVLLFLVGFTNIFYVMDFFEGTATAWGGYALQTYYIFFGAFSDPSPKSTNANWIYVIWGGFTVVFTIVVFNVLVALVTDKYAYLVENEKRIDNMLKLGMIIEVCQFRRTLLEGVNRFILCRKKKNFELHSDSFRQAYQIYNKTQHKKTEEELSEESITRTRTTQSDLARMKQAFDEILTVEDAQAAYVTENRKKLDKILEIFNPQVDDKESYKFSSESEIEHQVYVKMEKNTNFLRERVTNRLSKLSDIKNSIPKQSINGDDQDTTILDNKESELKKKIDNVNEAFKKLTDKKDELLIN